MKIEKTVTLYFATQLGVKHMQILEKYYGQVCIQRVFRARINCSPFIEGNYYEMAHFQTAPFVALYAIAILIGTYAAGRLNLPQVLYLFVGIQAAWEILPEALTIISNSPYYRRCYKGIPKLPRLTFWMAAGILTTGAWFIAFA